MTAEQIDVYCDKLKELAGVAYIQAVVQFQFVKEVAGKPACCYVQVTPKMLEHIALNGGMLDYIATDATEQFELMATREAERALRDTKMLTLREVARRLGVHACTLRDWDRDGKLRAVRTPGNHRRYRESDVAEFERTRRSN